MDGGHGWERTGGLPRLPMEKACLVRNTWAPISSNSHHKYRVMLPTRPKHHFIYSFLAAVIWSVLALILSTSRWQTSAFLRVKGFIVESILKQFSVWSPPLRDADFCLCFTIEHIRSYLSGLKWINSKLSVSPEWHVILLHRCIQGLMAFCHSQVYNLNKDNQAEGSELFPVLFCSKNLSLTMNSLVSCLCLFLKDINIAVINTLNKRIYPLLHQWSSWMWRGSTWWKSSFMQ